MSLGAHKRAVHLAEAGAALLLAAAVAWNGLGHYREKRRAEESLAGRGAQAAATAERPGGEGNTLFAGGRVEHGGKSYRRNTYVKAVLLIGVDRAGELTETTAGSGGQADGIVLAAQDTARGGVKLLMIPRDTMTEITMTDLSGNVLGKGVQHLNLSFAYGDGRERSAAYTAEAVTGLLKGLPMDHYLAADMEAIQAANDRVGGVTVTVPAGMEGAGPPFTEGGRVTLLGEQAERFVRYRDTREGHSALYRMERQGEYLRGFLQAVAGRSETEPGILEALYGEMEPYLVTDMGKAECLGLAADVMGAGPLGAGDIYTLPGQSVLTARYDEFYPDEAGLVETILGLFYREEDKK